MYQHVEFLQSFTWGYISGPPLKAEGGKGRGEGNGRWRGERGGRDCGWREGVGAWQA